MSDDRPGWGILATGGIAGTFTDDLQEAGLRVAAVGSRTDERAAAFAQQHGIPHAHGSWAALAADPDVDVVYVATPPAQHAQAARVALEHGKHVLVEKAFTLNAREAMEVLALARERGLIALEAMWTRWLPHMLEIHEVIADGTIGEVRELIVDHDQLLPSDPHHRLNDPALGGGAMLDVGVYPISFATDLLGEPDELSVVAELHETGVDRRVSGTLVHRGGAHTVFATSMDLPGPNRASILGTAGSIEIERTWYAPTGYTVFDDAHEPVRTSRPRITGRGMQFEAFELERLIREGLTESPRMTPAATVSVMRTIDRIRADIGVVYPQETAG